MDSGDHPAAGGAYFVLGAFKERVAEGSVSFSGPCACSAIGAEVAPISGQAYSRALEERSGRKIRRGFA